MARPFVDFVFKLDTDTGYRKQFEKAIKNGEWQPFITDWQSFTGTQQGLIQDMVNGTCTDAMINNEISSCLSPAPNPLLTHVGLCTKINEGN